MNTFGLSLKEVFGSGLKRKRAEQHETGRAASAHLQPLNERVAQLPIVESEMVFGACGGAGIFDGHDVAAAGKLGCSCRTAAFKSKGVVGFIDK